MTTKNSGYSFSGFMAHRNYLFVKSLLIILLTGLFLSGTSQTNNANTELQVKAAYLYNFTKFVYGNSQSGENTAATITIGLIQANPIADLLDDFIRTTSQKPEIIVRRINSEFYDLAGCRFLYIDRSQKEKVPKILALLKGSAVVTVSDIEDFARRGGMIGFFQENGRIRIEINLSEIKKSGLEISAKLIEVARVVR